jgi:hypothetical protein
LCRGLLNPEPFQQGTPSLFTYQFQAEPCRCSRRVATTIECIDLGCASNLMRVLISLTAPSKLSVVEIGGVYKVICSLNHNDFSLAGRRVNVTMPRMRSRVIITVLSGNKGE